MKTLPLISLAEFVLKQDKDSPSCMTKSEMQELLLEKYRSIIRYAKFLDREITFEMFEGDDRLFDGLQYVDIQPSISWNYWQLNGVPIFRESNNGKLRLKSKISDLAGHVTHYNLSSPLQ